MSILGHNLILGSISQWLWINDIWNDKCSPGFNQVKNHDNEGEKGILCIYLGQKISSF